MGSPHLHGREGGRGQAVQGLQRGREVGRRQAHVGAALGQDGLQRVGRVVQATAVPCAEPHVRERGLQCLLHLLLRLQDLLCLPLHPLQRLQDLQRLLQRLLHILLLRHVGRKRCARHELLLLGLRGRHRA